MPEAQRLYGVVVIVVVFSVVVQGGLVPLVAERLGVPMRTVEPEPWALGVRLQDEPEGVRRLTVAPGSDADGTSIEDLDALADDFWVSIVIRGGSLVAVRRDTVLRAGDEVPGPRRGRGCRRRRRVRAAAGPTRDGSLTLRGVATATSGHTRRHVDTSSTSLDPRAARGRPPRLRELAADVARTEESIAATFDQLAETRGDPDGHRRRVADEARRAAAVDWVRAAGAIRPRQE